MTNQKVKYVNQTLKQMIKKVEGTDKIMSQEDFLDRIFLKKTGFKIRDQNVEIDSSSCEQPQTQSLRECLNELQNGFIYELFDGENSSTTGNHSKVSNFSL
jgi:hypothetical protein